MVQSVRFERTSPTDAAEVDLIEGEFCEGRRDLSETQDVFDTACRLLNHHDTMEAAPKKPIKIETVLPNTFLLRIREEVPSVCEIVFDTSR